MRLLLPLFFLFGLGITYSQELSLEPMPVKVDSLYREDQFYFSVSLNSLQNKSAGLNQGKFSPGFSFGFLRDMPINKKRTFALAPGLGFSFNTYNQNLAILKDNGATVYTVVGSDVGYSKNKFSQLSVEIPLELRWRSSTYESHKFWRIYGGCKMSYLLYDKSVFDDNSKKVVISNNKDFNKLQYGVYIALGYNSINLYAHYGLNQLFRSATLNGEAINMRVINFGVMLYIL